MSENNKLNNNFLHISRKSLIKTFASLIVVALVFWLGLVIGMKVQQRSALSLNKCERNCLELNEVAGMVGAVGIELNLEKIFVQKENDQCFLIKMPTENTRVHYVMIPKKDIKDIGDLNEENILVINECLKIIGEHIQEEKLETYQVSTNGPNYQHVRYLHFHLKSIKE